GESGLYGFSIDNALPGDAQKGRLGSGGFGRTPGRHDACVPLFNPWVLPARGPTGAASGLHRRRLALPSVVGRLWHLGSSSRLSKVCLQGRDKVIGHTGPLRHATLLVLGREERQLLPLFSCHFSDSDSGSLQSLCDVLKPRVPVDRRKLGQRVLVPY